MAEIDFKKYKNIDQIIDDIKSITIQGATNVAIATFEGVNLYVANSVDESMPRDKLLAEVETVALKLANARPNEPLAKNGVKFIMNMIRIKYPNLSDTKELRTHLVELSDEYLSFVKTAKDRIVEHSEEPLQDTNEILTHCHSSTAERIIINQSKRVADFRAVATETRPLFQGRITAKNLVDGGVDTTLIVDSAAESFIIGKGSTNIDMVFIGCDEITMAGDAINKIGSYGVALASYFASKPLYVVGSILKTDISTAYKPVEIEIREANELWEDAPEGLKMVNPSFEMVNKEFITGYITELGVLKPDQISKAIQREYQWLF